jgi:putative phosphoribosyl transferase
MHHVLFLNRIDAGYKLAKRLLRLKEIYSKEPQNKCIVVVAIPRGGVIIGDVIASELDAKLDIVVSRKIGSPDNSEFAIGAVMPDGSYFSDEGFVNMLNVPSEYIEIKAKAEINEITRRLKSYRGSSEYGNEFENMTVVLTDDGIATGSTILASAKWMKDKQNCKELFIAAPVAPLKILDNLNELADKVIVLETPEPFIAIGRFYEDFAQVTDDEVKKIMRKYGYKV